MSHQIDERPIYEGKSYYFSDEDPVSVAEGPHTNVDCLRRLQMELAYKPYYVWDDLVTFLDENGLNYMDTYDKNVHYVKMLNTVVSVLQALGNNIDLFMKVEMNFGSRSEAYSNLQKRLNDLKNQIKEIERGSQDRRSDFSFMFHTRELSQSD